jgi:Uma2 family endonuclease
MAVGTLISVEEYLRTSYDPDVEYIDGVIEERNVGEREHSLVQSNLIFFLRQKYPKVGVWPEWRSRTRETRFRVPDVCVTLSDPHTKILIEPAFLVIEILSDEDRMSRVLARLQEFAANGVPHIWLIDPQLQAMFVYRSGDLQEIKGDVIATADPELSLTRAEIFQE